MTGRSGERGSGISVLAAQHHDDDDDKRKESVNYRYTHTLNPWIIFNEKGGFGGQWEDQQY